jgi:hypothetical protein
MQYIRKYAEVDISQSILVVHGFDQSVGANCLIGNRGPCRLDTLQVTFREAVVNATLRNYLSKLFNMRVEGLHSFRIEEALFFG